MQNSERTAPIAQGIKRKPERRYSRLLVVFCLWANVCLPLSKSALAQQPAKTGNESRKLRLDARSGSSFEPPAPTVEQEASLPGDWGPELLDAILSSPNPDASDALYRAAFAAGHAIFPQLKVALKDDRTAEFAAQLLAFIGGDEALEILSKLVEDPRDLNLRRFYYAALGEIDTPQAREVLLNVVNRSDAEPDRTVSEVAVLALTVHSDLGLVRELREAERKIKDVVIRDDVDNAIAVIESRARFLASPEGRKSGTTVESAIRTYFAPALRPPPPPNPSTTPTGRPVSTTPPIKVDLRNVVLSPDKTRALARVIFEDSTARAQYDIVLQMRNGNWRVVGVWLGSEAEKPEPKPRSAPERSPRQE